MAKGRILAVDDEEDILDLIKYNLEREGYSVTCVESGEDCVEKVREQAPDMVLLDLMLPGIDGLGVCRILKADAKTASIPIVMLTAKGEESDIVSGLELGAEDYITKPFSTKVLIARVRSVLRRLGGGGAAAEAGATIKRRDIVINPGRRETIVKGVPVNLTFSEFEILMLLARRPGWVYTRSQIVNEVKGSDYPVTERAVDVQIVGLRKKLGDCGVYIETIRGVGYRFKDRPWAIFEGGVHSTINSPRAGAANGWQKAFLPNISIFHRGRCDLHSRRGLVRFGILQRLPRQLPARRLGLALRLGRRAAFRELEARLPDPVQALRRDIQARRRPFHRHRPQGRGAFRLR